MHKAARKNELGFLFFLNSIGGQWIAENEENRNPIHILLFKFETEEIYSFLHERGYRKKTFAEDDLETYKQNGHVVSRVYASDQINELVKFLRSDYKHVTEETIIFPRKGPVTFKFAPKDILNELIDYSFNKIFSEK
jgi:hypothetical protein